MRKQVTAMIAIVCLSATGTAMAQNASSTPPMPWFLQTFPEQGQADAWSAYTQLMGPGTAIQPKDKLLISLAVSAQIPCAYCIYSQTAFARRLGATDEEIREAVAVAGFIRLWSTILNGNQTDMAEYQRSIDAGEAAASSATTRPATE